MKLTEKLKDQVEKAESKNQAKEIIAQAGTELTDKEMDMVTGGIKQEIVAEHTAGYLKNLQNN